MYMHVERRNGEFNTRRFTVWRIITRELLNDHPLEYA